MVITRSDLRVPSCFITGGIIDREESWINRTAEKEKQKKAERKLHFII